MVLQQFGSWSCCRVIVALWWAPHPMRRKESYGRVMISFPIAMLDKYWIWQWSCLQGSHHFCQYGHPQWHMVSESPKLKTYQEPFWLWLLMLNVPLEISMHSMCWLLISLAAKILSLQCRTNILGLFTKNEGMSDLCCDILGSTSHSTPHTLNKNQNNCREVRFLNVI